MSLKKYSTFEEASKDMWVMTPNDDYYNKLKAHFEFWKKLYDKKIEKGIKKFSSYEEYLKSKS